MEIQPTAHNRVALANEMQTYFESIEDSFENSLKDKDSPKRFDSFLTFWVFGAIFSAIPVVPLLAWLLSKLLLQFAVIKTFAHSKLLEHSFFYWWIMCAAILIPAAALLNGIDNRLSKRRNKELLDPAPLRFALCYSIVQEINRFSTNRLPKHLDRALKHWRMLRSEISGMVGPMPIDFSSDIPPSQQMVRKELALSGAVRVTEYESLYEPYPWFRLEPVTKKILAALQSLRKKVTGRLKDKKDLPSVAAALEKLSAYFYSAIPELSSLEGRTSDDINLLGEHSLIEFADLLEQLPAYSPEPVPLVGKKKVRYKLAMVFTWIASLSAMIIYWLNFLLGGYLFKAS